MGSIINVVCDEGRIPWISLRLLLMTLMYYPDMTELKTMYEDVQKNKFNFKDYNFWASNGTEMIKYILNLATKVKNDEDHVEIQEMCKVIVNLLSKRTELRKRVYRTHHKLLLREILLKYFYINMANNFALTSHPAWLEKTDVPVQEHFGCALYPFTSLINHACASNLRLKFIGENNARIMIFVSKPIKAGEQIFITYKKSVSFLHSDKKSRQEEINTEYGFECSCLACTNDYPLISQMKQLDLCTDEELECITNGYIDVQEKGCVDEAQKHLPKFIEILEKYIEKYPCIDCYKLELLLEFSMSTIYRSKPFLYE